MKIKSFKAALKSKKISELGNVFRCNCCGAIWSPNIREGGKLPRFWATCPNGCNKK